MTPERMQQGRMGMGSGMMGRHGPQSGMMGPGMMRHGGMMGRGGMRIMFAIMDADGDGALALGEIQDIHARIRSEEHTSELQSLMRISYAVFCLQKKKPY